MRFACGIEGEGSHLKPWNILRNCRRKRQDVCYATRGVAQMRNLAMTWPGSTDARSKIFQSVSRRDLLRWQFALTWSLMELHLEELKPEDFLWEPATYCWTVRPGANGVWMPDWVESEPDPVPVPTVGRITWHIGWWWSVTMDHAQRRAPRDRGEISWPGDGQATIDWLRGLRTEWLAVLERLTDTDLDATAPFPWQDRPEHTVAHMVGWVNSELMKNTTEIGQHPVAARRVGGVKRFRVRMRSGAAVSGRMTPWTAPWTAPLTGIPARLEGTVC